MFKASLNANGTIVPSDWTQMVVTVQGMSQKWPIMPLCWDPADPSDLIKLWLEFNNPPGPHALVEVLADWIGKGKPNDTPTSSLNFAKPPQANAPHPVLFVCSKPADDGVRPGAGLESFWSTSRIFLVHPAGPKIGKKAWPSALLPGDVYNVVAQIGNAGAAGGRAGNLAANPKVTVRAQVFPFNTYMGVAGVTLPSLGNLDPAATNGVYEQYAMPAARYDLAGFRFDAGDVFAKLQVALEQAVAADPNLDLNGLTPKEWLAGSHPCVKVRIAGDAANNKLPGVDESPADNARIAQRNLAVFDHDAFVAPSPSPPLPPSPWHHFLVEQPLGLFEHGRSNARLTVRSTLAPEVFHLYVAMSKRVYARHFEDGEGLQGFRVVTEKELAREFGRGRGLPFPDAVVLRAASPAATLDFALDSRRRFLALSLGIVHDVAKHPTRPGGAVSVSHEVRSPTHARHAGPVGGFTIEIGARQRIREEG
jgi:hypothetical protein